MNRTKGIREARGRRHARIRKRVAGNAERPRMNIFRSNRHIYAQIINDREGTVLASVSSLCKEIRGQVKHTGNLEAAKLVGARIAEEAAKKSISKVVFDRGGYLYHGRIKALADAAREKGLSF